MADKQRRENQRQARIDACRECAASVVSGQPTVAGVKILDPASEELISLIIAGCKMIIIGLRIMMLIFLHIWKVIWH